MPKSCPFCNFDASRVCGENQFALALWDKYPVNAGHTLVVPRKHVAGLFDLPAEEQAAVWALVAEVRQRLLDEVSPAGFNIGVNDGQAAGQTILHAHVHVIPRYAGDTDDPRGGVRWIIPKKARYW